MIIRKISATLGVSLFVILTACGGQANAGFTPGSAAQGAASQTDSTTIKSAAELRSYLVRTAQAGSPLDALTPAAKTRFISSLTFNSKGVTGYSYVDLQSELTAGQVYKILSLFGIEGDTGMIGARVESAADSEALSRAAAEPDTVAHKGYECANPGTCSPDPPDICTSNC